MIQEIDQRLHKGFRITNLDVVVRGGSLCPQSINLNTIPTTANKNVMLSVLHNFFMMCDIQCKTYRACTRNPQHRVRGEYLQCNLARARPQKQPCTPPSGQLRNLPLTLDVQNMNLPGECPMCAKRSPSNSSD